MIPLDPTCDMLNVVRKLEKIPPRLVDIWEFFSSSVDDPEKLYAALLTEHVIVDITLENKTANIEYIY